MMDKKRTKTQRVGSKDRLGQESRKLGERRREGTYNRCMQIVQSFLGVNTMTLIPVAKCHQRYWWQIYRRCP
jgi:hypothetical protein